MNQADEKLVIEGGKLKFLTQDRQIAAKDHGGVVVDYLRFTVHRDLICDTAKIPPTTDDENLCRLLALKFAGMLGYELGQDRPGRDYYAFTTTVENAFAHEVASVSAGGNSQRGTVCFTLKGEGCTHALPGWEYRVHAFFERLQAKITRIDLARDFYAGEVSIAESVAAYQDHAFSYQKRLPSITQYGDWINGHSRTFQVGKRESGKLCRVYEKGHQFKLMDDPWTRVEVELRSVNRVIPWDALLKPGAFFAGAYEFCNWLIHHHEVIKVKTCLKVAEAGVQTAVNWMKRVVAPTLVQFASALPDFDWLTEMVLDNQGRKMPRALRGLNHHTLQQALEKVFGYPSTNPGSAVAA